MLKFNTTINCKVFRLLGRKSGGSKESLLCWYNQNKTPATLAVWNATLFERCVSACGVTNQRPQTKSKRSEKFALLVLLEGFYKYKYIFLGLFIFGTPWKLVKLFHRNPLRSNNIKCFLRRTLQHPGGSSSPRCLWL